MARKQPIKETDLARAVVEMMTDWEWEVFQEVVGLRGRADIVGRQGNILWAVECKATCGLAVLEQAYNWRMNCHYSSIAVPAVSRFAERICREYGIGILRVHLYPDGESDVVEVCRPRLNRRALGVSLAEEQKTVCAAGSTGGGHWTSFKATAQKLIRAVQREPGIEFGALLAKMDHHYSSLASAKSSLKKLVGTRALPGLRLETRNGRLVVFCDEAADGGGAMRRVREQQ